MKPISLVHNISGSLTREKKYGEGGGEGAGVAWRGEALIW